MAVELNVITAYSFSMTMNGAEGSLTFSDEVALELFDDAFYRADNMYGFYLGMVESVDIEEINGETIIHVVLDSEYMLNYAFELIGRGQMPGFSLDTFQITMVIAADGTPLSMTTEREIYTSTFSERVSMYLSTTYTFNAFGDDVTIAPPAVLTLPEGAGEAVFPGYVLVGIWVWDVFDGYEYMFHSNGSGMRGFPGRRETFAWSTTEDGGLTLDLGRGRTELWSYEVIEDALTITSRQVADVEFSYSRVS